MGQSYTLQYFGKAEQIALSRLELPPTWPKLWLHQHAAAVLPCLARCRCRGGRSNSWAAQRERTFRNRAPKSIPITAPEVVVASSKTTATAALPLFCM